jgi:electron transport complex protein RnfC
MPVVLAKAWEHRDMEKLRANGVLSCINCGACSYVCPARRPLSAGIKQAKELVMAQMAQAARAEETADQADRMDETSVQDAMAGIEPAPQEGGRNDD